MSNQTFKQIFNDKINKEKLRKNVIERANKHSVDFHRLLRFTAVLGCLIICIVLVLIPLQFNKNKISLEEQQDIMYDADSIEYRIGTSQYVFIAYVRYSEKDNYKISVIENIKGTITEDKVINLIVENTSLEEDNSYILMPTVINGELRITDANKAIKLENISSIVATYKHDLAIVESQFSPTKEDKEYLDNIIKKYKEYYKNQIIPENYEKDYEISKYDINYKE